MNNNKNKKQTVRDELADVLEFTSDGMNVLVLIDPNKGYTIDNIVPMCKHCVIKYLDVPYDEFVAKIKVRIKRDDSGKLRLEKLED